MRTTVPVFRALTVVFLILVAGSAFGQPAPFTKSFTPSTIGPGSTSTVQFTITNSGGTPITDLAFTDNLPAAVTIASPASASTTCLGSPTLSAPAGGGTITFSGGSVGASSSCTITVNVTSSTPGTHTNPAITLSSSAGSSMSNAVDLTVTSGLPGFSKSFSPSSVAFGERSTLTFTIDNSANASAVSSATFTDNLPTGMVVANPSNKTTTCLTNPVAPTFTASPGAGSISYQYFGNASFPVVAAGATCTISVDVIGGAVGTLDNTSSDLSATIGFTTSPAGKATASLTVTGGASDPILLVKDFTDDPVQPGGNVNLRFTITNTNRSDDATGVSFTDDLDATLSGLVATGLPATVCNGGTLSGTSLLTLSGASLPAGTSCSFDVTLSVPAGATPGTYTNTTSTPTATVRGAPVSGNAASSALFVETFPVLTKSFTDDPVAAGGTVTLEFTITNTSSTSGMANISFIDELTTFLPFPVSVGLPPNPDPPCGVGSSVSVIGLGTDQQGLFLSNGNLAASGSCTFSVTVNIPDGFPGGTYTNTTREITAELTNEGNRTVTGPVASDDLVTYGAPRLTKDFTDDPTAPGAQATLEFTIEHDSLAPGDATAISFTDDLNVTLSGLTFASVSFDTCGGSASGQTTTNLSYSGGALTPGFTCILSVLLDVPAGALAGVYTNTTSDITATVGGLSTTGLPASADFRVAGLTLFKEFIDDPAIPGDTTTLRFTLDNVSGTSDATSISFTDNLADVLPGTPDLTVSTALPAPFCNGTLSLAGSTLSFSGGSVTSGTSCSFDVVLGVPAGATDGVYNNVTSNVTATLGGSGAVLPSAFDTLTIDSELLAISKSFTDDPAVPGGTVTLDLTLTNLDPTRTASAIAFTDDLDAALSGLTINSIQSDDCGGTSSGVGTGLFDLSGGTLAGGASCTISLLLDVPAGPLAGNTFVNTTSTVSGTINGLAVSGAAASDTLHVDTSTLEKAFVGVGFPGQAVDLTFTITNLDSSSSITQLSFSDSLPGGLTAITLPSTPCGPSSQITGSSFLTFTGGEVAASGSCNFTVTLLVPAGASPGSYLNTSTELFSAGLSVAGTASDTLVVEPPPGFSKAFTPATIGLSQTSTLTFTINNTGSTVAATVLDFTDNLPAGLAVASVPSIANTCGGIATAAAGSGTISLTGGTVGAGATCTLQVNVVGNATGMHVNVSGDLTSTSGNSGTATDTLEVVPQPGFTKAFAPATISINSTSILTFTIDNSGSTISATALDFTDNLPAGVVIGTPANASTTCTGGTLTATAGTGTITYTGGAVSAGATCTVQVDVTSATPGTYLNTSGSLTSSLGTSGTASDTLTVAETPIFSKAFGPAAIAAGSTSTLTFTIDNTAGVLDATGLDFTDNLPAGVLVATVPNASTTCAGGTLTAAAGTGTITYNGGTVTAGSTCTVQVDVTSTTIGNHVNTSGNLFSSLGDSGPASDTLTVVPAPAFSKVFNPTAIPTGATSTLTFTIDNTASVLDATALDVTDNLPAGVVVATTPNASTTCTGGTLTAAAGSGSITYTGGTVSAGTTCSIQVDITSTTVGDHINTSGNLTSSLGTSGTATDTLTVVSAPIFTKAFAPAIIPAGATSTLTFTIDNTASVLDATSLDFTDNLPADVVVATPANASTTCTGGTLTAAAGTGAISYTGGTVTAGTTCTVQADVTSTTVGDHINTSGNLTSSLGDSGSATDTLTVVAAPIFTKTFAPATIDPGQVTTLTFTIDNSAIVVDATALDFTDNLPADLLVANPASASTTCTGGTLTAVAGSGTVTYTGGTVSAGATCTITVDVTSSVAGLHTNTTGDLTSSLGNSGTATDTLTVTQPLSITKAFVPNVVNQFGVTTVILTLDNASGILDATGVGVADNLPTGLTVADPPNAMTTCTGGTLTAVAGASSFTYTGGTVPAGTTCTIQVDVLVSEFGNIVNTTEDLSSSFGNSGPAAATLNASTTQQIPTLDQWALILMALLLTLPAVWILRD